MNWKLKDPIQKSPPEIRNKNNDKKFKGKAKAWKIGLGDFNICTIGIIKGEKRRLEIKELIEKIFTVERLWS